MKWRCDSVCAKVNSATDVDALAAADRQAGDLGDDGNYTGILNLPLKYGYPRLPVCSWDQLILPDLNTANPMQH
jgi:hypothetical protein